MLILCNEFYFIKRKIAVFTEMQVFINCKIISFLDIWGEGKLIALYCYWILLFKDLIVTG